MFYTTFVTFGAEVVTVFSHKTGVMLDALGALHCEDFYKYAQNLLERSCSTQ